jgi:hypothetical protein
VVLPSGLVISESLALAQAPNLFPAPVEREISWVDIDHGTGAIVAEIYSLAVEGAGANDELIVRSRPRGPGRDTVVALQAFDNNAVNRAQVSIEADASTPANSVAFASANGITRRIIDGGQKSDFLQFSNIQRFVANGPVPIGWNVTIRSPTAVFAVSGTGFDGVIGRHVGLPIIFDGVQRDGFDFFFNIANTHMTLPTRFFVVTGLTPGVKSLTINASGSSFVTDANDFFAALVLN